MIKLDYNNEKALIQFVEKTNYFDKPLLFYKADFELKRPFVNKIIEFENHSKNVNPKIKKFTIEFSEEMNIETRNFELGPLGESNVLRVEKVIGFSDDKKTFQFESSLEPNKTYQLIINFGFRSKDNYPLIPYLIDFSTSNQ